MMGVVGDMGIIPGPPYDMSEFFIHGIRFDTNVMTKPATS